MKHFLLPSAYMHCQLNLVLMPTWPATSRYGPHIRKSICPNQPNRCFLSFSPYAGNCMGAGRQVLSQVPSARKCSAKIAPVASQTAKHLRTHTEIDKLLSVAWARNCTQNRPAAVQAVLLRLKRLKNPALLHFSSKLTSNK